MRLDSGAEGRTTLPLVRSPLAVPDGMAALPGGPVARYRPHQERVTNGFRADLAIVPRNSARV